MQKNKLAVYLAIAAALLILPLVLQSAGNA